MSNEQQPTPSEYIPPQQPGPQPMPYYAERMPQKSNRNVWIVVLIVVLLLCCCLITISALVAAMMFGESGNWQLNLSLLSTLGSLAG